MAKVEIVDTYGEPYSKILSTKELAGMKKKFQ